MAAIPATLTSVGEYLRTSYSPDVEFVDGVLVHKGMPTILHGLLQAILISWFRTYEAEWRIKVVPEVRTQIIEGARYRIPDLLVFRVPAPAGSGAGKIFTLVPEIVIEILSPDDRQSENLARFRDYERIGVTHIVQMDPVTQVAHRYFEGSLIRTEFTSLDVVGSSGRLLPFDSAELFAQLEREAAEAGLYGADGSEE